MEYFLGVDQGSSGTKGMLIDSAAKEIKIFRAELHTKFYKDGRVEQSASEILRSIREIVRSSLRFAKQKRIKITAIGFALQRSGVLAWDSESLKPIHPLISWRDLRAKSAMDRLTAAESALIRKLTALPLSPSYAGAKIAHLQRRFKTRAVHVGTLDSFIIACLSRGDLFQIEESMAARTLLYDLKGGNWAERLCKILEVKSSRLPKISHSVGYFGDISKIPVRAMIGDQQSSLLGRMTEKYRAVLNLGTIASLSCSTAARIETKLGYVPSLLCSTPTKKDYLVEAISNSCSAINKLISVLLGRRHTFTELSRLCRSVKNPALTFFPLGGYATPYWRYDLENYISDWEGGKNELVCGLVEGLGAFIVCDLIPVLKRDKTRELLVSGGLADFDYLLQFVSDCSGLMLHRLTSGEATARGAALLALAATHSFALQQISKFNSPRFEKSFIPCNTGAKKRIARWLKLRSRILAGNLIQLRKKNCRIGFTSANIVE